MGHRVVERNGARLVEFSVARAHRGTVLQSLSVAADLAYAGGEVVFKSADQGRTWTAISPDLTRNDRSKQKPSGGPLTLDITSVEYFDTVFALAESPVERGVLWAGTAAGLAELPVDAWPSSANFILFRPRSFDGDQVWEALLERSVLVRNCANWPRLDGCLRVTVGTAVENDAFLSALREVLS